MVGWLVGLNFDLKLKLKHTYVFTFTFNLLLLLTHTENAHYTHAYAHGRALKSEESKKGILNLHVFSTKNKREQIDDSKFKKYKIYFKIIVIMA